MCHTALSEPTAAAKAFERTIELDALNVSAYANLAATWVERGDLEVALSVLARGVALTQAPLLLATQGALLAQIGDRARAIEILTQAHRQQPEDAATALILAEVLLQQQRYREAVTILDNMPPPQAALRARFYLARGRVFYGCGAAEPAKAAWREAQQAGAAEATGLLQHLARGWGGTMSARRIQLQPLCAAHAADIAALQQDIKAWTFYNPHGIAASTVAAIAREIDQRYAAPALPPSELAWAVYRHGSGEFMGLCQLVEIDHHNQRAELLMILQNRHQGFGVEALLVLINAAFNQYGLNKLVSLVLDTNTSVWDMELRLGFQQEGHLRQHFIDPATGKTSGLVQLALFKADFATSTKLQQLLGRFVR